MESQQSQPPAVSPETIEKKMVEESEHVGIPAFQFDPDAPPSKKAEQVELAIPSDMFKQSQTKAVGVSTDIVNGTSSISSKAPKVVDAGKPEAPAETNGELDEAARWDRHRTGWAPRFHTPEDDMDEGDTLLDHQTFIETKLDDKFFGDWYHNTAVIIFACLASWVIALLGGGLGWVFIVMAGCASYYRTSIRRVRRNFRDDINREMAKNRLETDTESLEWINSFLVKFWPIYAPVLCDSIINSVDQVLSSATPAFLDNLRLKTFVLGSKPPRLEHVKTYPKTEVDTVLMDWKFSFTPNDTMDLTARQLKNKINPKVVLEVRIGKALVSKGLDVIVEDFAFSGLMRVKVKLQIPFPHIERVDVCFLGRPEIDYVCKPLGGDLLGFDINFIPGLESFIKDQIHGNLGPMMYEPNVFPVEIAKMLAGNPVDQAIGVVAVTIHGAYGLKNSDKFSGSVDPYTAVSINSRTPLGRTKTIHDNPNPRWNETIYVIITSFTDSLTFHVYDWNEFRKDKELGIATFPLEPLEHEDEHENITLEILSSGRPRGGLMTDIRFFPVLEPTTVEGGTVEPAPESNCGIARFTIEQAKDLDGTRSLIGQLNPYGVLLLNGKEIHVTNKLKRTNNPIFQNPTKEVLVTDRKTARFGMMIKDDRDLATDPILGRYQMKLNDMLRSMEKGQEWFNLAGAKTGRVKLKVQWKPVALRGIVGGGGYVHPIGVMRIHIQRAKGLRNVETMGKSDPYTRVLLSGIEKGRTVTFANNLNPEWDEVIYVPMHSPREKLILQVMDEETIGKDRPLGMVELSAADYIRENENGEYEVDDEKQQMSSGLRIGGRGPAKGILDYTVAFYPTLNVIDPEEEEEEEATRAAMASEMPMDGPRKSLESGRASLENGTNGTNGTRPSTDARTNGASSLDAPSSSKGPSSNTSQDSLKLPTPPKIRLTPQDLSQYESGLIVFKLIDGQLAHSNVQLEVLMDDHVFPSYTSPRTKSKEAVFGDVGDAFVRELEVSKITLRLVEKTDTKGEEDANHALAKLTGPTLPTLQQCLNKPTQLTLRSNDGSTSKITVSLKYIPVKMKLDPRESINNMGTLRVDVLDAADLPSADRNGFSDPYCKFKLNGKEVFKTKVQKKTLHPAWNEFFECSVKSRIGADLRLEVYDWDFGDRADHLGGTDINLEKLEPFIASEISYPLDGKSGAVRLKLLFKPVYVMRSRQGSSTFSGTFAAPGKIVGAPVKGVGFVGGGVVKGASFIKHSILRRGGSKDDDDDKSITLPEPSGGENLAIPTMAVTPSDTPQRASALVDGAAPPLTPTPSTPQTPHSRSRSIASQFNEKIGRSGGSKGDTGTANFTIISAAGYPSGTNVRVTVKQITSKGAKEVHKTKAIKSAHHSGSSTPSTTPTVQFDPSHETFKVSNVAADAQFQLQVKDHATFGSDDLLGEALFFVDDQGSSVGREHTVRVGSGTVTLKSAFLSAETSSLRPGTSYSATGDKLDNVDSPERKPRRSFLAKRSVSGAVPNGD
ncbi:hypothetical protein RJZ56_006914 [Blastomyces dermatitidis]|uniref:Transmembrane protein n=2 Tax=Ajellomyces dermatitidis TaxID=5039 RepID=F2TLV2_AJEDA|nr:uncharacterized protein BDCG_01806 [Blastomyces dermatitidis ER-3]XP_045279756.1 transmembrane protein, variant [Blastomyces dermatitidis ER-3]EGE84215.1 transmembrane protein [Blastomyces dermatitidis ATCC 18188]EQL30832.1 hypothetical protein BDFG_06710 [Blastomyces dermatitidis ATCC 26199]EEQ86686.1 transmembrane protein [Blastomyces dermatitidis ER-3]EQL30833.1 hypothetical protein, variant [Blastomyces dermatitidis ATCC 26199]OAT00029.1 transmembrane protein, variant [Blastomyces derm